MSKKIGKGLPRNVSSLSGEDVVQEIQRFYAPAAVTDGDWVVIDTSSTTYGLGASVKKSVATTADQLMKGVANETVTAGSWVDVVVYGVKKDANVTTGTAIGPLASLVGSVAGTVGAGVIGTGHIVGHSLAIAASSLADVFVTCR